MSSYPKFDLVCFWLIQHQAFLLLPSTSHTQNIYDVCIESSKQADTSQFPGWQLHWRFLLLRGPYKKPLPFSRGPSRHPGRLLPPTGSSSAVPTLVNWESESSGTSKKLAPSISIKFSQSTIYRCLLFDLLLGLRWHQWVLHSLEFSYLPFSITVCPVLEISIRECTSWCYLIFTPQ